MNNIFDNVKVFAVTAVLFAVATIATAGDVSIHTGLTVTPIVQPAETSEALEVETAKLGPTMPPDPWADDDGK